MKTITVYHWSLQPIQQSLESEIHISFDELKSWVRSGKIFKYFFRFKNATLLIYDFKTFSKPFIFSLVMWSLARGKTVRKDCKGDLEVINLSCLIFLLIKLLKKFFKRRTFFRKIESEITHLTLTLNQKFKFPFMIDRQPIYLRTDLAFGLQAGGSIGHIAGVLNHLHNFSSPPILISSDFIPTINSDIETHIVEPELAYWDFSELPSLEYNWVFYEKAKQFIGDRKPSFIYQRYSANHFSGIKLAWKLQVPFILEYNGSEIWVNRHWGGTPLKYEALSEKIELLNLRSADFITVVSRPLKDELILRGIDPKKILVNPNGVDPIKYHPEIDGSSVRKKFNLQAFTVVGFIGTFGPWHGTEILAEAYCRLIHQYPQYKKKTKLLMIGNGVRMPFVKDIIQKWKASEECILTGSIAQDQGPQYLAACDILVSPQVPNIDGTPFFGSPTKLFEYMAMGKGIIASNLDQLSEILDHNHTAWMVKPGCTEDLIHGLKNLIDQPSLCSHLGKEARKEVVSKYTWHEHTQRIIDAFLDRNALNLKEHEKSI